jgi:alginate O-acetyltransferase complex protein AlgI
MSFISYEFLLFLATTWIAFICVPAKWRAPILMIASYAFYAYWSLPFIAVILATTTVDYLAAKYIAASTTPSFRKGVLGAAILLNLVILGLFKYSTFFLTSIKPVVEKIGLHDHLPESLNFILPLGISFYTFEAISYLVDVYRGAPAAPSWLKYNFFIMYFPHLLSGPIVRFGELYKQYDQPLQLPSGKRIAQGVELIILGYVFKVIFADGAATICDPMFLHPSATSVPNTYIGALAFAARVYFDLMGYTHIARGVSLLFNIQLPINFNQPCSATNIRNFWSRWHISLTRWITDYLFIPLAGIGAGPVKKFFVLLLVMTLAGAWHGAGWTFIIWGFYHGCLLALYQVYRAQYIKMGRKHPAIKAYLDKSALYNAFSFLLTQSLVVFSLVIFGSPNLKTMVIILKHLLRVDLLLAAIASSLPEIQWTVVFTCLAPVLLLYAGPLAVKLYQSHFRPLPGFAKAQAAMCAILLCWVFASGEYQPFIYFQF